MSSQSRNMILLAILAATALCAYGDEPYRVRVSRDAEFEIPLHAQWKATRSSSGGQTTVRISPTDGKDFVAMLTILALPKDSPLLKPQTFAGAIRQRGTDELQGALQDTLEWSESRGEQAILYLYHLTDRNPERGPGDYREAHQGGIHLGSHVVSVTILSHPGDEAVVELLKRSLVAAKIVAK